MAVSKKAFLLMISGDGTHRGFWNVIGKFTSHTVHNPPPPPKKIILW
jgi:hypothetical protein